MPGNKDDRGDALAWYVRLLVQQELDRGTPRRELLDRLGIQRGHLSQIESGKLGIGVPKLIQFAEAFGYTPGEMLNRALSWWEDRGRAEHSARPAKLTESGELPQLPPAKKASS